MPLMAPLCVLPCRHVLLACLTKLCSSQPVKRTHGHPRLRWPTSCWEKVILFELESVERAMARMGLRCTRVFSFASSLLPPCLFCGFSVSSGQRVAYKPSSPAYSSRCDVAEGVGRLHCFLTASFFFNRYVCVLCMLMVMVTMTTMMTFLAL